MKVLVTGGAGFIGSHLCEYLVNHKGAYLDKYTILCLDNYLNGNIANIRHLLNRKNFKLINGDIRDETILEKYVPSVDAIINLAAQIHVDRSIVEPKLTYDINVMGTQNVLEVARTYDVERVIHASTSEVYGSAQYAPMDENHPLSAPHPYGASKIAADRMCHAYRETYGMDVVVARPFNIFGTRQKSSGYGGVISIFTRRILNGKQPIIFGDGLQTRDYTYVSDVVEAYWALLNSKKKIDEINFGTGVEITVLDLAKKIAYLCGKEVEPIFVEPRAGEVRRLVANVSKAKQLLGWEPKVSLDQGLAQYVGWYRDHDLDAWEAPNRWER